MHPVIQAAVRQGGGGADTVVVSATTTTPPVVVWAPGAPPAGFANRLSVPDEPGGAAMAELVVEVDPRAVGLDPDRLTRIDRHFAAYVDDGRLAGWSVLVSRRGRIAHLATGGQRDAEAGLPVEPDTLWRIYSMTKPIVSVAAMALYEQGAFSLT